ncbi:MAG: response regulator [Sphingobacteriaceae bacterium]|nr:response regulator [Sphingobacteriaceae bacterium]
MLRAIIIDDEKKGINSLKLLLEKYIKDVKVVAETTDPVEGVKLIEDYRPEIVFLDIQMPNLNGFELLERLTYRNFNLIFTTAHQDFPVKAIKNNALDYLLKPIDHEDLEKAIERAKKKSDTNQWDNYKSLLEQMNASRSSKISLPGRDKVEYVNISDSIRLESDSNYTYVFTTGADKILVSKTIGDLRINCVPMIIILCVCINLISLICVSLKISER